MAKISSFLYMGGKGSLLEFVIPNLPSGSIYVEPYGGAAWVLLNKPRYPIEVYNDLDSAMVNLFRVLQDRRKYALLRRRLRYTLYSMREFERACRILNDGTGGDIDRAWAKYVQLKQGFSGNTTRISVGSWGRAVAVHGAKPKPAEFARHVDQHMRAIHERLRGVYIDSRDALEVIRYWDSPDTVFYLDPPYPLDTRRDKSVYLHEMDDTHHERLIDLLCEIKGSFALSSYPNPIYDRLVERGVARRLTREVHAHSIGRTRDLMAKTKPGDLEWYEMTRRIEALYIKGNGRGQQTLF